MKVLFTGDRWWVGWRSIAARLDLLDPEEDEIIVGDARGVDTIARSLAKQKGFKINGPHKADWDKYGRSAGPIRNRVMLDLKPDLVIAFHPNLGSSKGTKDCVEEAKKRGITVEVHNT